MRESKSNLKVRRDRVKELFLKGRNAHAISKIVGACYETVLSDLKWIQTYYTKLAISNPYIAEKQFKRIQKLMDEVDIVKSEFWEIFAQIKKEEATNLTLKKEITTLEKVIEAIRDKVPLDIIGKLEDVQTKLKMLPKRKYNTKLDTLKAILQRMEHESKILSLFNPKDFAKDKFITADNLTAMLVVVKQVVLDFVPKEKQNYAIERLKSIDIETRNGREIVEGEIVE